MTKDNHVHEWEIKELQCKKCNAISILLEDKRKFEKQIILEANKIFQQDIKVLKEATIRSHETNQKILEMNKKNENYIEQIEKDNEILAEENQKLKEDVERILRSSSCDTRNQLREENHKLRNKVIELAGDYTLLERENQKLKNRIKELEDSRIESIEREYELMADAGKLIQENKKLREEINKSKEVGKGIMGEKG